MGTAAVAKAFEDIDAALAVLNAEADGCGSEPFSGADPLAGLADGCSDILAGAREAEARFAGLKARAAASYADTARALTPDAPVQAQEMAIAAEIGSLLALGSRAAGSFLAASHALTTSRPRTLAALHNGTISWQHALAMVDETATLDPAAAAALEAHFLDPATPKPSAPPIGEIEQRHAKSVADRRIEYRPDQDGMAWLSAYLPAHQASAVWNRLTALSRGMQGPDESRTLSQLRADNFSGAILTSGSSSAGSRTSAGTGTDTIPPSSIRAEVLVTVPVFSLMGLTGEPAMLDGYGPIPGCSNHSLDNEADHILAWHKGGTTGISNLGQPCPKHHRLRHTSSWKPTPATKTKPPGWTSPTGRHYTSEHQDWEPPHWPPQVRSVTSKSGAVTWGQGP